MICTFYCIIILFTFDPSYEFCWKYSHTMFLLHIIYFQRDISCSEGSECSQSPITIVVQVHGLLTQVAVTRKKNVCWNWWGMDIGE